MIRRTVRIAAALALLVLSACSSIPVGTAKGPRSLDPVADDLSGLLVALDLPLSLEPVPAGSVLTFAFAADGSHTVRASLGETDPGDLAGTLPPPADDRNYYLFGLSPADSRALATAQAWARSQPAGALLPTVALTPQFCRTGEIDPAKIRVSALVALPNARGLAPLLRDEPLVTLLATGPVKSLPTCAGHSG